jgi:hydroxymethylglutaryl-CoA reductase (NADPH)
MKSDMENYPIVPGRGLISEDATGLRLEYVRGQGYVVDAISEVGIETHQLHNNIESFVGSVEIPLGLAGPLLFREGEKPEMVHAVVGTLEGALVASMNRGAKALSMSGGFSAAVLHQKMVRAPMFIFSRLEESIAFCKWVDAGFNGIKQLVEQYSNHAVLLSLKTDVIGKSVHVKFIYSTGDASGQNMTTSCTWHGILWMKEKFEHETGIPVLHYVIEGNGSSDKKVSVSSMSHGRGTHVVAECHLKEEVIRNVLRTTSEDIARCFNYSAAMSRLDGMHGYNINVANAIASIFVATGQDLACIHESGTGILNLEKTAEGLYLSLNLPSLVIGTVGGGTHLHKQKEALELMGCYGNGKVQRFAKLIAGFALSLEVSTYAAIVSGQFAKAHEKLGRNKPVNWLLRSEINLPFLKNCIKENANDREFLAVDFPDSRLIENGIIINLTSRISKKLIGFVPFDLTWSEKSSSGESVIRKDSLLIKSKPLDLEVVKGLHLMASALHTGLSDLISEYRNVLEYSGCHKKEISMNRLLHEAGFKYSPAWYGSMVNEGREIWLLIEEFLDYKKLEIVNSENNPQLWKDRHIEAVIRSITEVHRKFATAGSRIAYQEIKRFEPWKAKPLYHMLAGIVAKEYEQGSWKKSISRIHIFIEEMEIQRSSLHINETIIHNDFNSRNIAIRDNGMPCIYDWELAVLNVPHRDIVEFLSFTLDDNFTEAELLKYLQLHQSLYPEVHNGTKENWKHAYIYALKEYIVTRITFYLLGNVLMKYGFAERIFNNAFRMLHMLENPGKL